MGDLAFWHVSIIWTKVANASLLVNLAPVFVSLVVWLRGHERLGRGFLAGLFLALAGSVPNQAAVDQAKQAAMQVPGVKTVDTSGLLVNNNQ